MPVIDKVRPEEMEIHFLIETDEEAERARRRAATLFSIAVHLFVVVMFVLEPYIFRSAVESARREPRTLPEHLTYLAMPPDNQVAKVKPKTDVVSDKDRVAQPGIPDIPGRSLPPLPPPRPAIEQLAKPGEQDKKAVAQPIAPPPQIQGTPQALGKLALPEPQPPQIALQEPPKLAAPQTGTSGQSLEEVMRGVARDRATGAGGQTIMDPGLQGVNPRAPGSVGQAQILSDTQGVNFDPYLQRAVASIKSAWYSVMPEIARMGKKGRVVVNFDVQRDGMVQALYLVSTSGAEPLDRAALAAISASVPFMPLPAEFKGPRVRLQVTFLYNTSFTVQ